MPKKIILFFVILLAATALAGGVYKWIDQKGITNYTRTPPPNTKVYAVNLPPEAPAAVAEIPAHEWKEDEREFQQRRAERQKSEQIEQEMADLTYQKNLNKKFICILARMNADALEAQRPVYSINEFGEKTYLDDERRTIELALIQKEIQNTCPSRSPPTISPQP